MKKFIFFLSVLFTAATAWAQPCSTPFATFTIADSSTPCQFANIYFTDSSYLQGDTITSYEWHFGDGTTSALQHPVYQYTNAGQYTITQYVHTTAGCTDSFTMNYTIDPLPVPNFSYTPTTPASLYINFVNQSSTSTGTIASYNWLFYNGGITNQASLVYHYATYGTYPMSLVATTARGCRDTITRQILVDSLPTPPPCYTSFGIENNNACFGTPISLRPFITDTLNTIMVIWNFGDGHIDTLYNNFTTQLHTYDSASSYLVTLTVQKRDGCMASYNAIAIVAPMPQADFSITPLPDCIAPFDVQFTNTSTIAWGALSPFHFSWNFGDRNSETGAGILHSYEDPGTYSVRLIVRSLIYNCRDTVFKPFTTYSKPTAAFTYRPDTGNTKTIYFTNLTTSTLSPVTQWRWDFGDGTTSTLQHPVHTYGNYGVHTVTYSCLSAINCTSDTVVMAVYTDSFTASPVNRYESNMGKEFWAGFGYQEKMVRRSGDNEEAKLSLYIAAGSQPAVVTISLPGVPGAVGFPRTVHIMADSIVEVKDFPTGDYNDAFNPLGKPDARLFYTGISKRGIHISSNQPVAVWEHIYAAVTSAGGSLLLPVNVWGNDYIVQTMGGQSNNTNPGSYFFVLAKEDSTTIEFTPAADVVDSSASVIFTDNHPTTSILYHAGSTYSVTLNRGEVFNAMGIITGDGISTTATSATGADLSGSRVKSTNPLKKIAVFAGNGRVLIKTTALCNQSYGSDNLVQQMFPKTVWGTRYITTPTKTMAYNIYRIAVLDTNTEVKLNGQVLPGSLLINHSYYQVENNIPNLIESNKRVMVTQYITSPECSPSVINGWGLGDPEMIILSPVKYAINNTSIYAAGIKNNSTTKSANFINVVLPSTAVPSFRIDNNTVADTGTYTPFTDPYAAGRSIPLVNAFAPHPAAAGYSYARLKVTGNAVHTLRADSAFTAIAYGVAEGESNGYNAGFVTNFTNKVYVFTGNGNWNIPANWQDEQMPPAILGMGGEIIIKGNAILNVPQTIEDGAALTVMTGGSLEVMGGLLVWE